MNVPEKNTSFVFLFLRASELNTSCDLETLSIIMAEPERKLYSADDADSISSDSEDEPQAEGEEEDWEEWNEEGEDESLPTKCLFCDTIFTSSHELDSHAQKEHHFNFNALKTNWGMCLILPYVKRLAVLLHMPRTPTRTNHAPRSLDSSKLRLSSSCTVTLCAFSTRLFISVCIVSLTIPVFLRYLVVVGVV